MDHRNRDCSCDRRGNRGSGRRIRGVTQRGEPLSSGGASYRGSSRVPAEGADKLSAKEGHGSTRSNHGKREREGSLETKKYEYGGRRRGYDFSNADCTDRTTQERVQYQRAGPLEQPPHR